MIDSTDNPGLYCAKFPEEHNESSVVVVNGIYVP
jgi:hypothetical protein